ncbi:MAG: hypothetical protein HY064_07650 [Bacteroidetes bacterium]|nr:hypothetical protein [Bacteroidota bacterium]
MSKLTIFASVIVLFLFSCNTGPGPGGQATITGKIYAYSYTVNSSFTAYNKTDSGYAANINVYLIYGDDPTYGDNVKTGPDGTYQFKYLRKGKYKVYAYTFIYNHATTDTAVIKPVEITGKKDSKTMDDIVINVKQ